MTTGSSSVARGILGGTFDPVHNGHLRLAVEARERLGLERVYLMPAPAPRLRERPMASAEGRLAMLAAAVEGVAGLAVDPREIDRDGPTRTVDTVEALRAEGHAGPLCFIVGADAFARIDEWHRWRALIDLVHFVVAARPGTAPPADGIAGRLLAERDAGAPGALLERPGGRVAWLELPALDVSATDVRRRAAAGLELAGLVPEPVRAWINTHGIYRYAEQPTA